NADGMTLTVADLVYLIRVIVNDAVPFPKPVFHDTYRADFTVKDNLLSIAETSARIGALHLIIEGEARVALHESVAGMEIQTYFNGENTSVIIYNMRGQTFLEEGPILVIDGPNKIRSVEAGSFDGQVMTSMIVDNLPRDFALSQNYPNPFNPITTIEFALPEACEWKLTVYNILGQVVETWSDQSNPGFYKLEWDAARFASGVYFYRLTAGKFSATKKMVLLK
ncbi:MAG: T9SS type A sorting domain-containing protein, partial [candidate division Zixibacteria bacterium]|nr:T9SS type A sorting domain-containing protein [candidate division Zixibacteria bacterium]